MSFVRRSLEKKKGFRKYIGPKRAVLFSIFLVLVFWIWNTHQTGAFSPAIIEQYRSRYPVQAVIFFILLYAASVFACLPTLPLNLAAGFFWGGLFGGIYSALAVTVGGCAAFAFARGLVGQPLDTRFNSKWLETVRGEFDSGGWKFVAFARINPIIPSGPLNYFLGLTPLSARSFIFLSLIFLLPPSVAVAYIGDTFRTVSSQQSEVREIVSSLLIISAAVTFIFGIRLLASIIIKKNGVYK